MGEPLDIGVENEKKAQGMSSPNPQEMTLEITFVLVTIINAKNTNAQELSMVLDMHRAQGTTLENQLIQYKRSIESLINNKSIN